MDSRLSVIQPPSLELLAKVEPFSTRLAREQLPLARRHAPRILQVNLGKLCNQVCRHCHVDAGPHRTEVMSREIMQDCLDVLDASESYQTVDLTGGAPELNPNFCWFVDQIHARGKQVIDRCNLTVLLLPRFADLIDFLADKQVEIVASLPYFTAKNTNQQRGDGVFEKSIEALQRLNKAGYGKPGSSLILTLVHNPSGAFLPPDQHEMETLFRDRLRSTFGIEFTRLFTITNQPISRFLEYLIESGNLEQYMAKLVAAFNPTAVDGLMCRDTVSVSWDGRLYDCDFNQMLELPLASTLPRTISELKGNNLSSAPITLGQHCYACTAGQGSSCSGATI